MIEGLFGRNLTVMERALDLRSIRQQMLSSDIANLETPGYRALDLDFKQSLRNVMAREAAKASGEAFLPGIDPLEAANEDFEAMNGLSDSPLKLTGVDGLTIGPDSNSANLELLMGRMRENKMMFQITSELVARRFKGMHERLDAMTKV